MKLPISEKKSLQALFKMLESLPKHLLHRHVGIYIRQVRQWQNMTQAQLARMCKTQQGHIAIIENGSQNPSFPLLKKISDALECDFVMIPFPRQDLENRISQQAKKKAEETVNLVRGTMALEEQEPSFDDLQTLIEEEQKRLIQTHSKTIWDLD